MLTTEQNKRIAKELDLAWYKSTLDVNHPQDMASPDCQVVGIGFDTWEGFRLIIENGPKMEWWDEFSGIRYDVFVTYYDHPDYKHAHWAIKQDYLGPQLAIALNEWLEGMEKCNEK